MISNLFFARSLVLDRYIPKFSWFFSIDSMYGKIILFIPYRVNIQKISA